jgi:hypothetical protein
MISLLDLRGTDPAEGVVLPRRALDVEARSTA